MHPLLRYTLDLFGPAEAGENFEPNRPPAPVGYAPVAPKKIATSRPLQPFVPGQPLRQAIAPAAFAHPKANREVRLEGAVVGYAFTRAKRRTIGFVVGPDGLVVRAPRWTPLHEVDAALQEKGAWILRKLNETRARHVRREEARIDWRDGTQLPVLGKTIAVQLDPAHSFASKGAELSFDGTEDALAILKVALPKAAEPQQIRDAVQAWLMRQAKDNFHQRLDHFAPLVGVQWRKLSLSNAGTRWGSARIDGAIRLNWRLIHFRQEIIDYVVVHELSHLRVMDHSPSFWDAVRSVVPDYADLRGQLKDDAIPKW